MQKLGAYNAMNIDGGASSGLYYKGKLLTIPGRDLSNATGGNQEIKSAPPRGCGEATLFFI